MKLPQLRGSNDTCLLSVTCRSGRNLGIGEKLGKGEINVNNTQNLVDDNINVGLLIIKMCYVNH